MAIDKFEDLPSAALFRFVPLDSALPVTMRRTDETYQKLSPRKYANAYGSEYIVGTIKDKVTLVRLPDDYIGSVSTGTMRIEDLIDAVDDLLTSELVTMFRQAWAAAVKDAWERSGRKKKMADLGWDDFTPDRKDELDGIWNDDIWEYLNDVAPEGCYFGAHPDDPADFGFWAIDDEV